jgi:IS6 family transposase
MSDPALFK